MPQPGPLPIGTKYDGKEIVEVVECDHNDEYQPHQYLLSDGSLVWIPATAPWYCQNCWYEGGEEDFIPTDYPGKHCCPECGSSGQVFPKDEGDNATN